jgi:hypothetical protein
MKSINCWKTMIAPRVLLMSQVSLAADFSQQEMAKASGQRYLDGTFGPLEDITVGIKNEPRIRPAHYPTATAMER